MEKIWEIKERKYDDVIDQILSNRSIIKSEDDLAKKANFLNPDFKKNLHDPTLLPDFDKVLKRIIEAKENKENVGIFADYDADGVPGAALLYRAFSKIGIKTYCYLPSRDEGYGLNEAGIEYLNENNCRVIITVDLGIRNVAEARICQKKGIDLIITDHHLPGSELPKAFAIVNPKLRKSKYPFSDLCGCGVVYKMLTGFSKQFIEIDEKFIKWNLDLVAISTISDMVALIDENRVFAKYGLTVLKKTKNLGLKNLYQCASIDPEKINTYAVGFKIGPRINSPGRVDHATKSFELLITEDDKEAHELALSLEEKNSIRQSQMDQVLIEAEKIIEKDQLYQNKIILVKGDWPKGVLGPPASKLVEKYMRPAIIFSEGEKILHGSARSVEGLNIISLIESVKENIYKFGGHKGAAGISVLKTKYRKFSEAIIKKANKTIADKLLLKKIKIDAEINISELNHSFYKEIQKLEPFGLGNPRPIFKLAGINFTGAKLVGGNQKHLSSYITDKTQSIKSIFFNCDQDDLIRNNNRLYDIVFSVDEDNWQGRSNISLNLIDVKSHE